MGLEGTPYILDPPRNSLSTFPSRNKAFPLSLSIEYATLDSSNPLPRFVRESIVGYHTVIK